MCVLVRVCKTLIALICFLPSLIPASQVALAIYNRVFSLPNESQLKMFIGVVRFVKELLIIGKCFGSVKANKHHSSFENLSSDLIPHVMFFLMKGMVRELSHGVKGQLSDVLLTSLTAFCQTHFSS